MVLGRDVSETISVRGADRLTAVLILDVDTGLVRGVAIEASRGRALKKAVGLALTRPAGDLPAGPPDKVLCAHDLKAALRTALVGVRAATRPVIEEVVASDEAEAIFDSLVGHLAGPHQLHEPPAPADWRLLVEQVMEFRRDRPWTRWDDGQDFVIEFDPVDGRSTYIGIVMGNAGVQRGLAVYPGEQRPPNLRDPSADPQPPPAGTLLLFLDPVGEVSSDVADRAIRHGWPANDGLVPLFLTYTSDGVAELGRDDAHRLSAAIAAVLAIDRRGPALAEVAGQPATGSIQLADEQSVRFSVRHRSPTQEADQPSLRVQVTGQGLIPPDTPVTVGHVSWQALAELRATAQVYRPAPTDAPPHTGRAVPLVVLAPQPAEGPGLAARIAILDPYGVAAVDTPDGRSALVLAGGGTAEILMELPAGHAALVLFDRRLRETKGRHAILIADAAAVTGDGAVYGLFECHQPVATPAAKKPAPRRRVGTANTMTRLRVTMCEVEPRVERIIDVPAGITLDELHEVLQVALGWTNSHLHSFTADGVTYARPHQEWDEQLVDDRGVRLSSLPSHFVYTYDFGDTWQHDVEILGSGDADPGCVGGAGACPPEDCGGTSGYAELLEALGDPRHREHRDMKLSVGDRLRPFDLAATDAKVRAVVGQVPDSVRILLYLVGDGVKLTQAGRLPRVLVRAVQERRPEWFYGDRPANREDDSAALSVLHEMLRRGGVLRLVKGVLQPTKPAIDDREVVRRVRSWFEEGSFDLMIAERAVAQLVAHGPMSGDDLAAVVFPWIGHGWRRGDDPIGEVDVRRQLGRVSVDLKALDMITRERDRWVAGPSARTVLPGVVLLADLV